MAASSSLVSLDTIANIVRKACAKYGWDKRDSTFKTFLKHLKGFASDFGLTPEDMAKSSEIHAKNIDYSSIPAFNYKKKTALKARFQNIPYIIYVDDDNITNVVIRKGNVDCPIKEITTDMMQMLSYLGVIRVYVSCECELVIPCWTDNIVHLEINQVKVIHYLDDNRIPFPKYLQVMVDTTLFAGNYTNWLPDTLVTLFSACTELHNISASLQYYTYTGTYIDTTLSKTEYLPIGIKNVIYNHSRFNLQDITVSEITTPPGTQYLEVGFYRICVERLIIKNVKTLFITHFANLISGNGISNEEMIGTNLTIEYSQPCECCRTLRQHVELILVEGLEHLIINLSHTFENGAGILESILQVPSSLKNLTIYVNKKFIDKHGTDIELIYKDKTLLDAEEIDEEKIIRDFILRFPHIKVSIEPEPQQ
jgi:hypothetical protein